MFEDNGNKCGKCQNHEFEVLKKGHARDCPFKKCNCRKCRLLDARSDILQVISGKETKLKGTKKDPNCGFCQNHGIKILRKGHVRSCGYGQERHFRLDNCFDCEVHYIRNEVNRLQIKMRRAMKEDRSLSEEQRKTAREAITRDEVEKVCDMAKAARKKRESVLRQQVGETSCSSSSAGSTHNHSNGNANHHHHHLSTAGQTCSNVEGALSSAAVKLESRCSSKASSRPSHTSSNAKTPTNVDLKPPPYSPSLAASNGGGGAFAGVWRPWSMQPYSHHPARHTAVSGGVATTGNAAPSALAMVVPPDNSSRISTLGDINHLNEQPFLQSSMDLSVCQSQDLFNTIFSLIFASMRNQQPAD